MLKLTARQNSKLSLGERLAKVAVAGGPAFIKLGQAVSTRADLFGPAIAHDLSRLRDRLPPFPTQQAKNTISKELGHPVEELFSSFEDAPVAAASIAQVHFATTLAGECVAIKVLRPGIERAFSRDLEVLRWMAQVITFLRPTLTRLRLPEAVETLAEMARVEMDLRLEAAAATELRENFETDPTYNIPEVFWKYTSQRVLVTSRVAGVPIDQIKHKENDICIDQVLQHASRAMFNQIFRDGFFHGDPHPGNVLVDRDGTLQVVDFGIMGRLDVQSRLYIAETLLCIFTRQYDRAAQLHVKAGYVPPDTSIGAFSLALRSIVEPILNMPACEISVGKLLGHLFQITSRFGMETQPHLLLLQKVVVIAEGTARDLNPSLDTWEVTRPLVENWVKVKTAPETQLKETSKVIQDLIRHSPGLLSKFEAAIRATDFKIGTEPPRIRQPDWGLKLPFWLIAIGIWLLVLVIPLR
ncbi:MAG: AarF/UbiB family protein [Pseudomonadota bacterium]|nr:AarF/UbiB family protein [Pseudomonadota bacterium]